MKKNLLGTKEIETERLLLKVPTMKEQYRLWEILMIPEVNKFYLTVPKKFGENLKSWVIQEKFYEDKIKCARDIDRFEWSIFLKGEDICIGQINAHLDDKCGVNEKNIGWFIDPIYQGNGYATEAAEAMFKYMFNEIKIDGFITEAATVNSASWLIMEKFKFTRLPGIFKRDYTFNSEECDTYMYSITKDEYFKTNSNRRQS